jgi:hypothetical protein
VAPSPNAVLNRIEFVPLVKKDEPPPAPTGPALVIQCGRPRPSLWEDVVFPRYGYRLHQGAPQDNWGAPAVKSYRWEEGNEVRFELFMPQQTPGKLRLLCLDPDNQMRKTRIIIQGKQQAEIGDLGPKGKWYETTLSADDTKDGKVEIKLQKAGGPNATVSVVEFTPTSR